MVVEYKLLKRLGEPARETIIELKKSGYKTEPAFAKLLHIPGDPYEELLEMYRWPEDRLDAYIKSYLDKEKVYE
jgi:GTP-dependent phosphoenolpyruvate carboxykinase